MREERVRTVWVKQRRKGNEMVSSQWVGLYAMFRGSCFNSTQQTLLECLFWGRLALSLSMTSPQLQPGPSLFLFPHSHGLAMAGTLTPIACAHAWNGLSLPSPG